MDLLIVGKPNVGKTLLMINLAAYLGIKDFQLDFEESDGVLRRERFNLERARHDLVSLHSPKTLALQSLAVELMLGRQKTALRVIDSCGMKEGIADSPQERLKLAMTLERLYRTDFILHVIDASAVGRRRLESPGPVDVALADYGRRHPAYILAANKMDRPGALDGYRLIKEKVRDVPLAPVSALTRRGFRDLKAWLVRALV